MHLEFEAITLKRTARHELWLAELSPKERRRLGVETFTMRISGEGIARQGLNAIKGKRGVYDAEAAISCLHDALLAVAKGDITPDQVREFFWKNDLAEAKYHGGVLDFVHGETAG